MADVLAPTDDPFVVVARWHAADGNADEVARLLVQLATASRQEAGCLDYRVLRDREDPARFLILEVYVDETAFTAHHDSAHFQQLARQTALPLLDHREVGRYAHLPDEVDA